MTNTLSHAKEMRRAPTDAERQLWSRLRAKRLNGWKFRRQQPIGPYIADFACLDARLIVEVDGSQHADSARDAARDDWLGAQGFRIMRFWNNEVLENEDGVLVTILAALEPPLPNPSPQPLSRKGRGAMIDRANISSPLAGVEGARARQRVGRRGGEAL